MSGLCVLTRQQSAPLANSARCFTVGRALREALAAATRSSGLSLAMMINMDLPLEAPPGARLVPFPHSISLNHLIFDRLSQKVSPARLYRANGSGLAEGTNLLAGERLYDIH
jgi:hypothetical protein